MILLTYVSCMFHKPMMSENGDRNEHEVPPLLRLTLTVYFFSWEGITTYPSVIRLPWDPLPWRCGFLSTPSDPSPQFLLVTGQQGDHGGRAQAPALMWACPYLLALLNRQVTRTQNCWRVLVDSKLKALSKVCSSVPES